MARYKSIQMYGVGAVACVVAASLPHVSVAQERTAASAMDTQMTWSALSTMVGSANDRITALNGQMEQSILCNKVFKAYAPGAPGADNHGCIENALIKQLVSRMDTLEATVNTINTRLSQLEGVVTRIDKDLTSLTDRVKALTTRVTVAEKNITALEKQMAVVETKLKTLEAKLNTERVERINADKEIEKDIRAINKEIDVLDATLEKLSDKVDEHQALLKKIQACSKKRGFYAPDHEAADTNGCITMVNLKMRTKMFSSPIQCGVVGDRTCRSDEDTANHACEERGYAGASGVGSWSFDSPGDNNNTHWNATSRKWVTEPAKRYNLQINNLTCYKFTM